MKILSLFFFYLVGVYSRVAIPINCPVYDGAQSCGLEETAMCHPRVSLAQVILGTFGIFVNYT